MGVAGRPWRVDGDMRRECAIEAIRGELASHSDAFAPRTAGSADLAAPYPAAVDVRRRPQTRPRTDNLPQSCLSPVNIDSAKANVFHAEMWTMSRTRGLFDGHFGVDD